MFCILPLYHKQKGRGNEYQSIPTNILQFYPFFTNGRCKIKDIIKLCLRFVHSRNINITVLVFTLRSELFYFLQFHPTGNSFAPWPSFWMSNQNEMRKLSWITHRSFPQSPVHFFSLAVWSMPGTNRGKNGR
jgi:hypothetical protein